MSVQSKDLELEHGASLKDKVITKVGIEGEITKQGFRAGAWSYFERIR